LLFNNFIENKEKIQNIEPLKIKDLYVIKSPELRESGDSKLLKEEKKEEKKVSQFEIKPENYNNNFEHKKLKDLLHNMNKKYRIQSDPDTKSNKSKQSKQNVSRQNSNGSTKDENEKKNEKIGNSDSDAKDYYNVHKMCIELDNIHNDQEADLKCSQEMLLLKKENISINDALKDENYLDTKSDTIKSEDIKLQMKQAAATEPDVKKSTEQDSDYSQLEVIREELERELGEVVLSKVYKIVEESVPFDSIVYNHELISKGILKSLLNNVDNALVLLSIGKIPEIFSLVIRERESQE